MYVKIKLKTLLISFVSLAYDKIKSNSYRVLELSKHVI